MQIPVLSKMEEAHPIFLKLPEHIQQHSWRVKDLSLGLARQLSFPVDTVCLTKAALYHDIGKLSVSPLLVNKTSKLTAMEMSAMCCHARWSGEIMRYLDFDKAVVTSVLLHHENFDGSGYPQSLSGASIPIESRIIRIVDTWDALTSKRPYKDAFSHEKAMDIMVQQSANWDPQLFQAFCQMIQLG